MSDLSAVAAFSRTTPQLPVHWYFDPAIYEVEKRLLFDEGPGYVGHELMVPNIGDYHSLEWLSHAKALVRNESKLDRNWVVRLRELPESPETYYLTELMASNDFQESLQNYFDLEELRGKLAAWTDSLDAFGDIIGKRGRYYDIQDHFHVFSPC